MTLSLAWLAFLINLCVSMRGLANCVKMMYGFEILLEFVCSVHLFTRNTDLV